MMNMDIEIEKQKMSKEDLMIKSLEENKYADFKTYKMNKKDLKDIIDTHDINGYFYIAVNEKQKEIYAAGEYTYILDEFEYDYDQMCNAGYDIIEVSSYNEGNSKKCLENIMNMYVNDYANNGLDDKKKTSEINQAEFIIH